MRTTVWRAEPGRFALAALLMGALYLGALWVVRSRPIPVRGVVWILGVAVALNLLGSGLRQSDDVNRYVVEGQQILHGENPYRVPPDQTAVQTLVTPDILLSVNHPTMTAIYPPVALMIEAGVQAVSRGRLGFTVLACVSALLAIALSMMLVVANGLPPALILAVAWNPVLPIFASGEAHTDVVMAVLLLLALVLASRRLPAGALLCASLAILIKPLALMVLPGVLTSGGWRRWWIGPAVVLAAYLPFSDAGTGLFASLMTFGREMHFHGAIEPLIRRAAGYLVAPVHLESVIRMALLLTLAGGVSWVWLRRSTAPAPTVIIRLLAVLLLCLPTLHPWYFIPLVVLLPFTRSWGLALWTAGAGIYWLHGIRILAVGAWTETAWVTALAHLPALMLLLVEEVRFPRPAPNPDTMPLAERIDHA